MPMVRCESAAGLFPTPRVPRANMGDLNILSRPGCWSAIERAGEYAGSRYILKPDELSFRTACPEQECRERSSLRGSRAAALPSDMMLRVISYWVLSGAKRRQIQQLRCCVLPIKLLKRRDIYLKLTQWYRIFPELKSDDATKKWNDASYFHRKLGTLGSCSSMSFFAILFLQSESKLF